MQFKILFFSLLSLVAINIQYENSYARHLRTHDHPHVESENAKFLLLLLVIEFSEMATMFVLFSFCVFVVGPFQ